MKKIILLLAFLASVAIAAKDKRKPFMPPSMSPIKLIDGKALGISLPLDAHEITGYEECSDKPQCAWALKFKTKFAHEIVNPENGLPMPKYRTIRGVKAGCGNRGDVRLSGGSHRVYMHHPCLQ